MASSKSVYALYTHAQGVPLGYTTFSQETIRNAIQPTWRAGEARRAYSRCGAHNLRAPAVAPLAVSAQAWPSRPISYVVPFTPGGTTDTIGRTLAQGLAPVLGQPVVVDNKPGAAGGIGANFVAKAPDGYTLFGGTISTHAINASLYKDLSYDPVKDFEPVALVAMPNALWSTLTSA